MLLLYVQFEDPQDLISIHGRQYIIPAFLFRTLDKIFCTFQYFER